MTAIWDSRDPKYRDEKATRDELTRVFDTCNGCRACVDVCPSFDTLFELLGPTGASDAGRLSPAQQDAVVDRCFHCDACVTACEPGVDVPKTMIRARAMRRASGHWSLRERWVAWAIARPATWRSLANMVVDAPPGSIRRRIVRALTGVTAHRRLPRSSNDARPSSIDHAPFVLVPACLGEVGGSKLVSALGSAGVDCSVSRAGCCGAASLHAGDVAGFARLVGDATERLAAEIGSDGLVVVGQPGCASVLRRHAVDHVDPDRRDETRRVADAVTDAAALLLARSTVRPSLDGVVLTLHEQATGADAASKALLEACGATVEVAAVAAGVTSAWHLRAGHDPIAEAQRVRLVDALADRPGALVGSDELANLAVAEAVGRVVHHPIELWATGDDETAAGAV